LQRPDEYEYHRSIGVFSDYKHRYALFENTLRLRINEFKFLALSLLLSHLQALGGAFLYIFLRSILLNMSQLTVNIFSGSPLSFI